MTEIEIVCDNPHHRKIRITAFEWSTFGTWREPGGWVVSRNQWRRVKAYNVERLGGREGRNVLQVVEEAEGNRAVFMFKCPKRGCPRHVVQRRETLAQILSRASDLGRREVTLSQLEAEARFATYGRT